MTSSEEVNITTMLTQLIPMQKDVEVFLLALNIFLAITASLGNALILNALPKVTSLHSPTKLLFGNLAVTDLCVGLISQPLFVTIRLSAVIKMNLDIQYYLMNIANAFDFILCGVSILTLSAISVDRLLALLLGIRYRTIVNLRHTRALLSFFWLTGIAAVLLRVFTSFSVAAIVGVIFLIIVIVISVFCYTKIFMTLRQFETQVQNRGQQRREGMSPNIGRYKKTVWSIAWVQLALIACYIPFIICAIVIKIKDSSGTTANTIWIFTFSLIYVNSSLNPILYCWRIKDARQEVKATIRRFCCHSS